MIFDWAFFVSGCESASTIPRTEFNFAWLQLVSLVKSMEDAASDMLAARVRCLNRVTIDSNRSIPIVDESERSYKILNWFYDLPHCEVSTTGDGAEVTLPVKSKEVDGESYKIPVAAPKFTEDESVREFHMRMCLVIRAFQQRLYIITKFCTQIPSNQSTYCVLQSPQTQQETVTEYNENPFGSPKENSSKVVSEASLFRDLDTDSLEAIQFDKEVHFPFRPSDFAKVFRELPISAENAQACNLKLNTAVNMLLHNMRFTLHILRNAELRGQH
eukprot:gb/GECG01008714.1/.p1 GENE.gb/GECG01008714.1/~~gb/GECG01008714.1/.p1  ORF type:complete len:273 (+),score=26.77 gb/GECG01008714.1/:1-819(+)